tara:strand:- start:71 stop:1189 length:1119 start_codon:yes stop_codon:yes gene_type:complete
LTNQNNKLYYIIAGEASGDLHGYHLMSEIFSYNSSVSFRGIGGPLMQKKNLKCVANFSRMAVMGFWEVFKDLGFFLKTKKLIINDIKTTRPEKIILIDYPGFNLSLAKTIKKTCNIPVIFYISPQVWAWKESRYKKIKKYVDKLIVLFPFEVDWYLKKNIRVKYFGHPLVDLYKKHIKNYAQKNLKLTIGLFPGSRKQEIKYHLPLFIQTINRLNSVNPNFKFLVSKSPALKKQHLVLLKKHNNVQIINNSWEVFNRSSVALVVSGTATLECAISETPFITIYKTSYISWIVAKFFLSIRFISIVNILAKKQIVKELLQKEASVSNIETSIMQLLNNSKKIKNDLILTKKNLDGNNAYKNTAQFIVNFKLDV